MCKRRQAKARREQTCNHHFSAFSCSLGTHTGSGVQTTLISAGLGAANRASILWQRSARPNISLLCSMDSISQSQTKVRGSKLFATFSKTLILVISMHHVPQLPFKQPTSNFDNEQSSTSWKQVSLLLTSSHRKTFDDGIVVSRGQARSRIA
jgi:hypothetical protein